MVGPKLCFRLCTLCLLALACVLLFSLLATRTPPAVQERYVTVGTLLLGVTDDKLVTNPNSSSQNAHKPTLKKRQELEIHKGMWDRSHVFKVHSFVVTGTAWSSSLSDWNICLSSQCSVDLLFWVVEQVKTWQGPVSVGVFVPSVDYTVAFIMIDYMRTCFPAVAERVSFHMIYPSVMPSKLLDTDVLEFDCTRPEDVNKELVRLIRTDELIKALKIARYPQNLLRNTARQGCQAEFCFTPDIDMLSIPMFSEEINNFVSNSDIKHCNKCAYVIPTYEISSKASRYPLDKQELVALLKKRHAQRFHAKVFSLNQANSNLTSWEKLPSRNETSLSIAYNITTWRSHWEPVYVTQSSVPLFDERFIGYGFTRNSQVYEMRVAGYRWHMLDQAFLVHRGFQSKRSYTKTRRRQVAENNARFNTFVRELFQRYGQQLDDSEGRRARKGSTQSKKITAIAKPNQDSNQKKKTELQN